MRAASRARHVTTRASCPSVHLIPLPPSTSSLPDKERKVHHTRALLPMFERRMTRLAHYPVIQLPCPGLFLATVQATGNTPESGHQTGPGEQRPPPTQ